MLLLRRHCPLPSLLRKPPKPSPVLANQPEVLTANEPRLTGASAKSMSLDLDLDYQFDSPPASQAGDSGRSATALHGEHGLGLQPRRHRGGSKTASDPVRSLQPKLQDLSASQVTLPAGVYICICSPQAPHLGADMYHGMLYRRDAVLLAQLLLAGAWSSLWDVRR